MVRRRRCRHDSKPFLTLQPVEPPRRRCPGGCRRPRPPRRQKTAFPGPTGERTVQNRSIGTLAGQAQARYRLASVQCTNSARSEDFSRHFESDYHNANRAFPARYPPEHGDDSQALCLYGCGRPHHRTRRVCGIRPEFPPRRHGLSRSGQLDAPRFLDQIRTMAQARRLSAAPVHHQRRNAIS
jgi:hypothetical protein